MAYCSEVDPQRLPVELPGLLHVGYCETAVGLGVREHDQVLSFGSLWT